MQNIVHLVTERHFAETAFVGFDTQVYSDVSLEIALLDKLLGAVRTLVAGPYVDQKMLIEGVPSVELLPAVLTFVYHVLLMTHSVVVEAVLREESLSTVVTEVRVALWMIHFIMNTPLSCTVENLVANFTHKPLLAFLTVRS